LRGIAPDIDTGDQEKMLGVARVCNAFTDVLFSHDQSKGIIRIGHTEPGANLRKIATFGRES